MLSLSEDKFFEKTIRIAYFERIKKLEKELLKARKKAEDWSEKTMELIPRRGIRGGRATTYEAKCQIAWEIVREIEKQINILNQELKRS